MTALTPSQSAARSLVQVAEPEAPRPTPTTDPSAARAVRILPPVQVDDLGEHRPRVAGIL